MRAEYLSKGLQDRADTFALCRIIGNDLPPRHKSGQSLENLRFLLENEPDLEDCTKSWIVNRIIDPERQKAVTDLLDAYGQTYSVIPFEMDAYAQAQWNIEGFPRSDFMLSNDYEAMTPYDQLRAKAHIRRDKILYAINNNGARNAALEAGRDAAKWVLPWDGNCFLTKPAWDEIRTAVSDTPYLKYFVIPMSRVADNSVLTSNGIIPEAEDEPQVIFRCDADEMFRDDVPYGRRPKVDLLWRLGVPGLWDQWTDDVWDPPRSGRVGDAGSFGTAGWVARLESGQEDLEPDTQENRVNRAITRSEGLIALLDDLDQRELTRSLQPDRLTAYNLDSLQALAKAPPDTGMALVYHRLLQEADLAMRRGIHSVLDKAVVPPSGNKQDYYNPTAFWWPDPRTENGLPGEWRNGKPAPGSQLYSPESESYDRTRLQRVLDDTTVLAMAGYASSDARYSEHAARQFRTWFLSSETAMTPHLQFAGFNPRNDPEEGSARGLVDMKDMHVFLDAVRLLRLSGVVSDEEDATFRAWLGAYLEWLQTSEQGQKARRLSDFHGTCYDLQTAAIAIYLGDAGSLADVLCRARFRVGAQFGEFGQQTREVKKARSAHFCSLNLQAWMNLANLAASVGDDLWTFQTENGRGLALAAKWMLTRFDKGKWPYRQDEKFDLDRILPLTLFANARFGSTDSVALATHCLRKPIFHPEDGVQPFWMLATGVREAGVAAPETVVSHIRKHASEIAKSPIEGHQTNWTPSALEERLWAGYGDQSLKELEKVATDLAANPKDRESASWYQARWLSGRGLYGETLSALDRIPPERIAQRKDYSLLKADCLVRLGRQEEARDLVLASLATRSGDPSLSFAVANSYFHAKGKARKAGDVERLAWINKVYFENGLETIALRDLKKPLSFFNIQSARTKTAEIAPEVQPKVTVIIPVYNGEETISVALRSLQDQTWKNLEIIVSDDASSDETCKAVSALAKEDPRIKLLRGKNNRGAYVARNAGLRRATGEFVTVHDADDWSHPQKIELQVRDLLGRGDHCGAVTVWGRVSPDLYALSNWRPMPTLFTTNHSSLMLRRETFDRIGFWDRVRIGADMEFLRRFETLFGEDKITTVFSKVPMSLSLERSEALTRAQATHVKTVYRGVRLDYRTNYLRWQAKSDPVEVSGLTTSRKRLFPAPSIMLPIREKSPSYSEIFVADFSADAPNIDKIVELVSSVSEGKRRVAIFDWPDFEAKQYRKMHPVVEELVDGFQVDLVSAHQNVSADRLVLCDPFLARFEIEGLAGLDVQRVEALCVSSTSKQAALDQRKRRMPTAAELQDMFRAPCVWHLLNKWPTE